MAVIAYGLLLEKYIKTAESKEVLKCLSYLLIGYCLWIILFVPLLTAPTLNFPHNYSSINMCVVNTHIKAYVCNAYGSEVDPIYTMCYNGYIDYRHGNNETCSIYQGQTLEKPDALILKLHSAINGTCQMGYYRDEECYTKIETAKGFWVVVLSVSIILALLINLCWCLGCIGEMKRHNDKHKSSVIEEPVPQVVII